MLYLQSFPLCISACHIYLSCRCLYIHTHVIFTSQRGQDLFSRQRSRDLLSLASLVFLHSRSFLSDMFRFCHHGPTAALHGRQHAVHCLSRNGHSSFSCSNRRSREAKVCLHLRLHGRSLGSMPATCSRNGDLFFGRRGQTHSGRSACPDLAPISSKHAMQRTSS